MAGHYLSTVLYRDLLQQRNSGDGYVIGPETSSEWNSSLLLQWPWIGEEGLYIAKIYLSSGSADFDMRFVIIHQYLPCKYSSQVR